MLETFAPVSLGVYERRLAKAFTGGTVSVPRTVGSLVTRLRRKRLVPRMTKSGRGSENARSSKDEVDLRLHSPSSKQDDLVGRGDW